MEVILEVSGSNIRGHGSYFRGAWKLF